ncbi:docking protein 2-like [Atheta coriaria]|uniref:docking protein 2-like n=2 Tax=Dalotia coriaria TaxID=877792 RepID=UPI0031F409C1
MDDDQVIHSGILLTQPNSKLILKKTWQPKFCMLYKASKSGVERMEIYDDIDEARKGSQGKIITLKDCVKVSRKSSTYFTIVTKSGFYEFGTCTEQCLHEWVNALQMVAFRDNSSKITTLVEDNDLYCSTGEGIFSVRLVETEASIRCNLLQKIYVLALTPIAVQLREAGDNSLLYTWPYQFIRRYGYSSGKFTFEAGRKCDSGEGKFLLEHSNEQEIFRYITMKMKSMKKLLKTDSASSLECGDKQFQAVLNMEARSRSPLPPSPTTSTSLQDVEQFSQDVSEKLQIKAPQKPPRKKLPPSTSSSTQQLLQSHSDVDYEFVSKYDEVEIRDKAWQTLGTDEVKHNEHIEDNYEEDYMSWGSKMFSAGTASVSTASKVITAPEDDDPESYDKLNFFGSSGKLHLSGYKQVRPNPNAPPATPAFNEYDEVHTFESIRPADDSHLGYAVIRKKEPQVSHKSFNDTEYAVISKPKRV